MKALGSAPGTTGKTPRAVHKDHRHSGVSSKKTGTVLFSLPRLSNACPRSCHDLEDGH